MNDENLTSDELFKSGSTNGFINHVNSGLQNYQRNDIVNGIDEPRLHLLGERIQEANETYVKEIDDSIDNLEDCLDSLTLSTDGDGYADIHKLNGFHETDFVDAKELSRESIQANQIVRRGGTEECYTENDTLSGKQANLKEPDLPLISKPMSLNEELRSRGSSNPQSQHRIVQEEIDNRHGQKHEPGLSGAMLVANSSPVSSVSRLRNEEQGEQNVNGYNMAVLNEHANALHEDGTGARSKVKDTDDRKSKARKQSKGAKTRTSGTQVKTRASDSQVMDMPKPPFKLQEKKYDNDLIDPKQTYFVSKTTSKEQRRADNTQGEETENQRFPVEYLNPFADPKGIGTIKPGSIGNSELLPAGFKLTDNATGTGLTMAPNDPVVKPKTHGRRPNLSRMKHNNSDPQMNSTDSLAVQRGSVQVGMSISAENLNSNDSSPVFNDLRSLEEEIRLDENVPNIHSPYELLRLEEQAPSSEVKSSDLRLQRPSVRPKENIDSNRAAKLTDKRYMEKKTPNKPKDNINLDILRSQQEVINSVPPPKIEYINNLDTNSTKDSIPTKKVQNKDMKNTNRKRNMDKTSSVNVGKTDNLTPEQVNTVTPTSHNTIFPTSQSTGLPASQNSVSTTSQLSLPYPNLNGSVYGLQAQAVSPHVVPDTNSNAVERRNTSNEPVSEPHPVIVPYEHERNAVQVLPSLDESLQSNVLFGDGTGAEMSDEMLAKMLQEKYDKENTEIMRRNQYDVAPETLRLHNLTPSDFNVADGGYHDHYVFNDDLETDSILNRNMTDVYEPSPRSVNSDKGSNEPFNVVHNMLDQETDRLYPHSIADDSITLTEAEQYHPINHDLHPTDRENAEANINLAQTSERENTPSEIYVPYSTEEVIPPDDNTIYVRAEQEEEGAGRSDESFARSLQRKLLMEDQEQWDEELARQLLVRHI